MLTRASSSLPPDVEQTVTAVIGAAIAVHRQLGPGFLERIYKEAFCLELSARSMTFEREKAVPVLYRGVPIHGQRLDLVVEQCVLVELKAVVRLEAIHQAKVISYLKTAELRVGLLMNFHAPVLKDGLKRIVL
jgi:GxxExxY protein